MNDAAKDAAQSVVKDLTAVKNEIAHLSQQIAEAVNALAAAAQTQGRRSLRRARSDVDAAVSGASDSAGAVAGAAQNAASSVADMMGDVIQDRPLAAMAMAMGVGFIIGAVLRR